jgi:hypothetical protein
MSDDEHSHRQRPARVCLNCSRYSEIKLGQRLLIDNIVGDDSKNPACSQKQQNSQRETQSQNIVCGKTRAYKVSEVF